MCFVEVIDTAGQGTSSILLWGSQSPQVLTYVCLFVKRSTQHCVINGSGRFSFVIVSAPCRIAYLCSYRNVYSEGQGFILVYSIASRATFDRLEVFRQSMIRVKRQKPIFMLVGNKCDKAYEREVSREEGLAMARAFGCEFLETSAKTAQNVERLFMSLVRMLRMTKQQSEQGAQIPGKQMKEDRKKKCIIM